MKVSIIGTGYVGLVSGVCLADKGHSVVCIDVDQEKIAAINNGEAPFYEAGLDVLLQKNVPEALTATTDLHTAVAETDLTLIAVGTPFDGETIDLSQIKNASTEIGRTIRDKTGYHVVVVKSTVVPGTTEEIVFLFLNKLLGKRLVWPSELE